jgi:hypothetical protein
MGFSAECEIILETLFSSCDDPSVAQYLNTSLLGLLGSSGSDDPDEEEELPISQRSCGPTSNQPSNSPEQSTPEQSTSFLEDEAQLKIVCDACEYGMADKWRQFDQLQCLEGLGSDLGILIIAEMFAKLRTICDTNADGRYCVTLPNYMETSFFGAMLSMALGGRRKLQANDARHLTRVVSHLIGRVFPTPVSHALLPFLPKITQKVLQHTEHRKLLFTEDESDTFWDGMPEICDADMRMAYEEQQEEQQDEGSLAATSQPMCSNLDELGCCAGSVLDTWTFSMMNTPGLNNGQSMPFQLWRSSIVAQAPTMLGCQSERFTQEGCNPDSPLHATLEPVDANGESLDSACPLLSSMFAEAAQGAGSDEEPEEPTFDAMMAICGESQKSNCNSILETIGVSQEDATGPTNFAEMIDESCRMFKGIDEWSVKCPKLWDLASSSGNLTLEGCNEGTVEGECKTALSMHADEDLHAELEADCAMVKLHVAQVSELKEDLAAVEAQLKPRVQSSTTLTGITKQEFMTPDFDGKTPADSFKEGIAEVLTGVTPDAVFLTKIEEPGRRLLERVTRLLDSTSTPQLDVEFEVTAASLDAANDLKTEISTKQAQVATSVSTQVSEQTGISVSCTLPSTPSVEDAQAQSIVDELKEQAEIALREAERDSLANFPGLGNSDFLDLEVDDEDEEQGDSPDGQTISASTTAHSPNASNLVCVAMLVVTSFMLAINAN